MMDSELDAMPPCVSSRIPCSVLPARAKQVLYGSSQPGLGARILTSSHRTKLGGIVTGQQELVEQLFGAALEIAPGERGAFLERVCADRPGVQQRVEALLLEDERAGSFLERPLLPCVGMHPEATSEDVPPAGGQAGRFRPGQMIADRFTVIRFVASGGMGEVYEVQDRLLQNVHVALKVILPAIAADAGSSHRFEQEVLLARNITHPNLCPIYDIALCQEADPPFLFLTMKLLRGETLAARLRRSVPIHREEAVAISRQMVAGLAAIHAAGVIHRDIKPNNIMLEHSGAEICLFIMDFGLARLHESEATVIGAGLIAGTPGYLAPELFRGQPPSEATDIFALGVLLHRVLTGVAPSASSAGVEVSSSLAVSDVPTPLIHVIEGFLADDPRRRCLAFEQAKTLLGGYPAIAGVRHWPTMTRRSFFIGSALMAGAVAGGAFLERDRIENLLQPLPRKRFVALLNWPTPDAKVRPMLYGVIDAIASELSRAEAFDHNFFVMAEKTSSDITTREQLNEVRESLGANLVLAAAGVPRGDQLHLSLRVLDPASFEKLRETEIQIPISQQTLLPEKAVHAAARLLNVAEYPIEEQRARPGTSSLEAFAAFQAAEAFAKQPNDTGLDASIEKYKQAVELDPRYADAYARLAIAYGHFYAVRGDAAAVALARANAESALALDPNSVTAYTALACVFQAIGDQQGAAREIAKALLRDPRKPYTLTVQGQIYADSEEWVQAEETFGRVLRMRPNFWLARNELGVALYKQGKYPQAQEQFRAASLAAPTNAFAFSNLGNLYLVQGRLREALENTNKSFALNQNDAAASTIASIYRVQRDYANAIAFAERAVRLAPALAPDWLELGDCYAASGTHKAAAAAYLRAAQVQEEQLRLESKNGPGWMLLALCRIKANHGETGIPLIQKAEALHANDTDSQLYKVRILELLGHRAEALATTSRCLRRGATSFQVEYMPDLEGLRVDPDYRKVLAAVNASTLPITS